MRRSKHQSSTSKKKLQHQMYLAKESPEPKFDLSHCELTTVPSGVFSLCKVLQKEALLLHNNHLSSLHDGGTMDELSALRVLDLHCNAFVSLPVDLGLLECLQVLNIENNSLKEIPASICNLHRLQTLMAKGNKLKSIPESLCELKSLRTLDVSSNSVQMLPRGLCHIRTLEKIILDAEKMKYPSEGICSEGTQSIMTFLCGECGIEYLPPSNFVLDVLDPPAVPVTNSQSDPSISSLLSDPLTDTILQYKSLQDQRHEENLALEQQLEQEKEMQTQLALQVANNKKHLIEFLAQDQHRMSSELSALQQTKEKKQEKLRETLNHIEKNATALVNSLLEANKRSLKTEELADKIERDRLRAEESFTIQQSEIENLRKKDVFAHMQRLLQENDEFSKIIHQHTNSRHEVAKQSHKISTEVDGKVVALLSNKQIEQDELVQNLTAQEELQKEAFRALQLEKDVKHLRLNNQIEMIEQELSQLSVVECEQRAMKVNVQQSMLNDQRIQLAQLLVQLLNERQEREQQLASRLAELDEHRTEVQSDFWLVQFQRLMDRKPESLINMEKGLEFAVVEILEKANASDYISLMARNKISIETMMQLTDKDLIQMGVHEKGLRHSILTEINKYKEKQEDMKAEAKLKALAEPQDEWLVKPPPAAAAAEQPGPSREATAPPPEPSLVTARGINSECVVCMNAQSAILFLNCGHVCCCEQCASPLRQCPLCRSDIAKCILLSPQS